MFIPPSEEYSDASRRAKQHNQDRPRDTDELLMAAIQEPTSWTIKVCSLAGGLFGLGVALYLTWEYLEETHRLLFAGCIVTGLIAGSLVGAFVQGVARFATDLGKEMKREPEGSPSNLRPKP